MSTDKLLEQALRLDPADRFALVDEILHSLEQPDPAIDRLWIAEAERRLAAYRRGEGSTVPAEDVVGGF